MSQSGSFGGGSSVQTLTGDTGGAVPVDAAQNIDIIGGANVSIVGDAGNHNLTISVTGGYEGTGQTVGAVTDDIITFPLGATPGVYEITVRMSGFESTTPAGAGYRINAAVRTTGAAGTLIGVNAVDTFEEAALAGCVAAIVVVGNDAIVRATGVAALTIDWSAELDSKFQG